MIGTDKQKYWQKRAPKYNGFKWANSPSYLSAIIRACMPGEKDWILDLGVGTGLVAEAISPFVSKVVGLDNSKDMIAQCSGNFNIVFGDARDIPYPDNSFDNIIARNIFHHVTDGIQTAMNECRRVLKNGGKIIIGERIPPSDETRAEYEAIFKLKDKRIVFIKSDLKGLIKRTGFAFVCSEFHWIRAMSVKTWLKESGLSDRAKNNIFSLHVNGSYKLRQAHNMKIQNDDCLIDIKNVILVGKK